MIKRKRLAPTQAHLSDVVFGIASPKFRKRAERLWPNAYWITGDGRWGSISECDAPEGATVWLHETLADAEDAIEFIDTFGCGCRCFRRQRHFIVDMALGKALLRPDQILQKRFRRAGQED